MPVIRPQWWRLSNPLQLDDDRMSHRICAICYEPFMDYPGLGEVEVCYVPGVAPGLSVGHPITAIFHQHTACRRAL